MSNRENLLNELLDILWHLRQGFSSEMQIKALKVADTLRVLRSKSRSEAILNMSREPINVLDYRCREVIEVPELTDKMQKVEDDRS